MSFDVFMQAFDDGEIAERGADAARRILDPLLGPPDSIVGARRFTHPELEGTVYGFDDPGGISIDRPGGATKLIWHLVYQIAREARWAILTADKHFVIDEEMLGDLPHGFRAHTVIVTSGEELGSHFFSAGEHQ